MPPDAAGWSVRILFKQRGKWEFVLCPLPRLSLGQRCTLARSPASAAVVGLEPYFSADVLYAVFFARITVSAQKILGRRSAFFRLREIYDELIAQGAHNINLVNPTHFVRAIAQSLKEPLPVPVIYNCGGYESVDSLRMLEGKVQIYLPDFKYVDNQLAIRYSGTADYFEQAGAAIREMVRQTGPYRLDQDGMLCSGILIRHLILPGQIQNSKQVIDWISDCFPAGTVLFSLMSQYLPCGRAADFPEINRRLYQQEYDEVEEYLFQKGIEDGFCKNFLLQIMSIFPILI